MQLILACPTKNNQKSTLLSWSYKIGLIGLLTQYNYNIRCGFANTVQPTAINVSTVGLTALVRP